MGSERPASGQGGEAGGRCRQLCAARGGARAVAVAGLLSCSHRQRLPLPNPAALAAAIHCCCLASLPSALAAVVPTAYDGAVAIPPPLTCSFDTNPLYAVLHESIYCQVLLFVVCAFFSFAAIACTWRCTHCTPPGWLWPPKVHGPASAAHHLSSWVPTTLVHCSSHMRLHRALSLSLSAPDRNFTRRVPSPPLSYPSPPHPPPPPVSAGCSQPVGRAAGAGGGVRGGV